MMMMRKILAGFVFALLSLGAGGLAAQPVTVVAMGDSLTQGYGLAARDGFVPRLEQWLSARGHDVRLINAGVSGDTTAGGAARAAWTLTPEVDAMILALGANDLLRGIAPEASRSNLRQIMAAAQQAGVDVLVIGFAAPGNYGPDYKRAFDAIHPALADEFGAAYAPSFFAGLPTEDPGRLADFLQADRLHPNARGVERIVDALGPAVAALVEMAR